MILQNSTIPPRRKNKKRFWPYLAVFFAFVLAAVAGAMFASSSLLDKPLETAAEEGMLTAKDKSTIMIMGVDERGDDVGRSDTLMIATLDPKKNQAALLSVPRDTRVKIKGHGYDKINAAYAYGGHNLTKGTVESFLGVPMDHYVIINIQAFQRIIDAIGGIDIDVEKRMYYEDPWDDDGGLVINLQPGMQHMDGKTAITYVRFRDEEGDIGRIGRQQKFMKAVMEKITSPAIITKLPSVIKEVMSSVKTDLSFRQLLEFAGTLKEAQKNGLKTDMVPGRPLYIEGISYWIPDITKLRQTLADTLDISMSSSMRSAMEKESREYESSIPSGATAVPSSDTSIGHSNKTSSSSSKPHSSSSSTSSSHRPSSNESSTSAPASSGKTNSQQAQPADKPAAQPSPSAGTTSTGKTQ